MNTALKHWKEAATVILAAGTRRRPVVNNLKDKAPFGGVENNSKQTWPHRSEFDYEVLLLKRSGKSGFMPNAYVFPGGLVDSSDFSSDWLQVFKSFRNSSHFGLGVVKQLHETRPPIFATDRAKLGSPIPGEVAFRICAVRETFEESGILLVVPQKADETQHQPPMSLAPIAQYDKHELNKWRSLVLKNPVNFIDMCKELECMPNIWAMHEWGNWLTPTGVYGEKRRYDTAFFICCLQEVPQTMQDEKEIVHFKWATPSEILQSYESQEMWIAPPQFYELSRMCHFPLLHDLNHFSRERALEGCEPWLPVRLVSSDGYMLLLPGDELYPDNPDWMGENQVNMTTEKSLEELPAAALHRIEFHSLYDATVNVNIKPRYNHQNPISKVSDNPVIKDNSKL